MSTTYTANAGLPVPAFDDRNWHLVLIAQAQALDASAPVGGFACQPASRDGSGAPNSLTVSVAGGAFLTALGVPTAAAAQSATVPPSATTLLWLDEAGAVHQGTVWPVTAHLRVASVTAGASAVTAVADARTPYRAVPGGPPGSAAQAALADSTGGTASTTVAAVGATNASDVSAAINDNFAAVLNLLGAIRAALVTQRVIKGSA
jgi:hypothetical protein